jgi:hypothetical protein
VPALPAAIRAVHNPQKPNFIFDREKSQNEKFFPARHMLRDGNARNSRQTFRDCDYAAMIRSMWGSAGQRQ